MNMNLEEAIEKIENIPYEPWIELQSGDKEAIAIVINYVRQTLKHKEESRNK